MKEINSIKDVNKMFGEEIEKSISSSDNAEKEKNTKGCKSGFTITDEIVAEDKLLQFKNAPLPIEVTSLLMSTDFRHFKFLKA